MRTKAQAEVEGEIGFQLIADSVYDHGVVLNASLFGGAPQYHRNATPVLDPVIREPGDVTALARRIDGVSDEGLMHEGQLHPEYWRAAEAMQEARGIPLRAPASGGTKGVATTCGQLCTVTNFLTWIYTNPAEMRDLTALVGRTYAEFCASEERGLYERFAKTGTRYYHADSNMKNHVRILADIGVTDVNIGPMVSVTDILTVCPQMRIHGQVPPTQVLWRGSPDLVVDAVRHDLAELKDSGGSLEEFRVCTAGSVNPGTPLENIRAMSWAAQEYGRFDGSVRSDLDAIPIEFDRKAIVNQIS